VLPYNFIARAATLIAFISWELVWLITKQKAVKEKPKIVLASFHSRLISSSIYLLYLFVLLQIVGGVSVLPFSSFSLCIQLIGVFLVVSSMSLGISARIRLGANWTPAEEFQIKHHHELIADGIYRYIRHPLYLSFTLAIVGAELVAQSYLVFPFLLIWSFSNYRFAKREEVLLLYHFGDQYRDYVKKTKMFIPFVF
jgi:protein-S-isoprenylcysteine O-methyltransferase Ste14